MARNKDKVAPQLFRELAEHPAFGELMAWAEQQFARPHLEAPAPHKVLPNYGEECAYRAGQFAVVRELQKYVDNRKEK